MKIYTKTGDAGETSLYGGQRVSKDALRVSAYGTVDECNAFLGAALPLIDDAQIRAVILRIQGELFEVGADLATPQERGDTVPRIQNDATERLEAEIDAFETELEPLRNFILPGGSPGGAQLHVARAVSRRAERLVTTLAAQESISDELQRYLNRLSDHLFVLARLANHRAGVAEPIWERPARP
ncbi:ATP--cob(I)alamin adenosyltransferase [Capsulimonas corticalis]|uniref:Corrinoid adenosyltransferase n=1 Tax=Capsulimonas corticalis TaxID=2219043 RepID=A0A402CXD7_9BACT|nr:cob(I)yrinic acid a,c-diamide adenosyltransferase [Capsulimonas corticalis]BDI32364.1 ATP--cob(I)alamin adenosyltransferase [Capsulimonas corticalis]